MLKEIIKKGKSLVFSPQSSVLSAATIIMLMIIASRVLGLVRQRTLAHFFTPEDLSLFFAAFRLPDLVFEVLVFGTFSSAFIPVFTKSIKRSKEEAWRTASIVVNIGLVFFLLFSVLLGVGADGIYKAFAPGYSDSERQTIVSIARILFAAQGFFVISYVLTGVLESLRRFLMPALAPLFYNAGIILGTIVLYPHIGIFAPAVGVVIGAASHFVVQLPLAMRFGFRFTVGFGITGDIKKIARLAVPRVVEVSFLQLSKIAELFFASLISTASYTYFTFGNSLQLLPVGIFGTSIAKAALPALSRLDESPKKFKKVLLSALYDMSFFVIPFSTLLIVLRVPIVRLAFGTSIFEWEATVQTGYVLSTFALGVFFQAANALLARSFYALHDTRTPVFSSIGSILITICLDYLFVQQMGFGVWSLALAFTLGSFVQTMALFYLINRRLNGDPFFRTLQPIIKSTIAAVGSGLTMYFILKVFDRSVWVKRLSFLGIIEGTKNIPFEIFVLDTRYTVNLILLTGIVSLFGIAVYFLLSIVLGSEQVWHFFNLVKRILIKRKITPIPKEEQELVAPTQTDIES